MKAGNANNKLPALWASRDAVARVGIAMLSPVITAAALVALPIIGCRALHRWLECKDTMNTLSKHRASNPTDWKEHEGCQTQLNDKLRLWQQDAWRVQFLAKALIPVIGIFWAASSGEPSTTPCKKR